MTGVDERGRLEALDALGILDTGPEDPFDSVAKVAASLFQTPMAIISFIDARRQWFKCRIGIDVSETDREIAFCTRTIAQDDVFVVPDARADGEFVDNPLVTGPPFIRFYAGVPISLPSGARVGSLAVLDSVPRDLDAAGRRNLLRLGEVLNDAVEQRSRLVAANVAHSGDMHQLARRHRALLDASLDAIVIADATGRVVDINPAFEAMFGHHREDALGKDLGVLIVPPELRARHDAAWQRYLETREPRVLGKRVEVHGLHASGRQFPVELIAVRLPEEPPVFAAFLRDLTAQRRMQAELVNAQRMEAVVRFAGGVAHDFNNNLSVIMSYAAELRDGSDDPTLREEAAVEIHNAATRAADLTRQLLTFSSQRGGTPSVFALSDAVRELEKMLAQIASKRIRLAFELSSPARIRADKGNIEQALLNLVINARDAMPDAGTISISVEDARRARADGGERSWVKLVVTDTGAGMPPEVLAHVFEPFFTTKEHGTGLGLAMVFGIVNQLGGFVEARSEVGKGTTFELWLPPA